MFDFIVTTSEDGSSTTAKLMSDDVVCIFAFIITELGLNTLGGVLVAGVTARSNFTQHYDKDDMRRFCTDS